MSSLGGVCVRIGEGEGGGMDAPEATQQLKLMTVKDKLKANRLLDELKSDTVGGGGLIQKECAPSTRKGFVDVGLLNPCEYSDHVCVEDPSSSLGGTCVELKFEGTDIPERELKEREVLHHHLTTCTYRNGTSGGLKCSARSACSGLSEAFISSQIGCGSCVSCIAIICISIYVVDLSDEVLSLHFARMGMEPVLICQVSSNQVVA